jgi:hypothetical protein
VQRRILTLSVLLALLAGAPAAPAQTMGDRARAAAAFEEFIKREPGHPLAGDAKQALAALR